MLYEVVAQRAFRKARTCLLLGIQVSAKVHHDVWVALRKPNSVRRLALNKGFQLTLRPRREVRHGLCSHGARHHLLALPQYLAAYLQQLIE